jgi:hypothetical protein
VKRTPGRGVKQNLKPCAYKESEPMLRIGNIKCPISNIQLELGNWSLVIPTRSVGDGVPIEE